jgi:hypothetical protein
LSVLPNLKLLTESVEPERDCGGHRSSPGTGRPEEDHLRRRDIDTLLARRSLKIDFSEMHRIVLRMNRCIHAANGFVKTIGARYGNDPVRLHDVVFERCNSLVRHAASCLGEAECIPRSQGRCLPGVEAVPGHQIIERVVNDPGGPAFALFERQNPQRKIKRNERVQLNQLCFQRRVGKNHNPGWRHG